MKKIKYIMEYSLFLIFYPLLSSIPYRLRLKIGEGLGIAVYSLYKKRKFIALENIRQSFPEKSEDWHIDLCRESFRHFGISAMEFLQLKRFNKSFIKKYITIEGEEYISEALSRNKGIIGICPHLGNWEFVAAFTGLQGYPLSSIMKKQSNPYTNKIIENLRKSFNMELIDKKKAGFQVLRALKRNRIVAFVADQDAGRHGIFVSFFGRLASTAQGPARFALSNSSPALVFAGIREGKGKFRIIVSPIQDFVYDRENTDNSVMKNTILWTARIEDVVRRFPEQYFWMHRRWHTRAE